MLHHFLTILKELLKKQNPPLKRIKDGKNCYEKEKLPLTHISDKQIYFFLLIWLSLRRFLLNKNQLFFNRFSRELRRLREHILYLFEE